MFIIYVLYSFAVSYIYQRFSDNLFTDFERQVSSQTMQRFLRQSLRRFVCVLSWTVKLPREVVTVQKSHHEELSREIVSREVIARSYHEKSSREIITRSCHGFCRGSSLKSSCLNILIIITIIIIMNNDNNNYLRLADRRQRSLDSSIGSYSPYSTPLWNRWGAVLGWFYRLGRETSIS